MFIVGGLVVVVSGHRGMVCGHSLWICVIIEVIACGLVVMAFLVMGSCLVFIAGGLVVVVFGHRGLWS